VVHEAPSPLLNLQRPLRVLQAHNRHATRGGADAVLDQDRRMLEGAGHLVSRIITEPADKADARSAALAVWNRDTSEQVASAVREFGPDVLHVHTPFPLMSPVVFRAAHRHGVPTVATMHSFRFTCIAGTLRRDGHLCEECVGLTVKLPAVRHRCYHDSTAASASMATSLTLHHALGTFRNHVDRFLTMTEFAKDILVRDGIPPSHVTVKPNCVDDPGPSTSLPDRPHQVLFVGRLVEEKGVRTMLEGWRMADPGGYVLRVCGDGPLRPLVDAAAAEDPSIEVLGWLSAEDVRREQRSSRLTLVPSEWYEAGPPLVLLDSLATATPVLASDLDNISSTVRASGAGATFRTGSASSFAEELTRLLGNPAHLDAMSGRARALYEADHTPAAALGTLLTTYESVLEGAS
jgi:glycosyltransferase involved in cell wall biosynthesis